MKPRILRFPKNLPRIDTLHPKTSEQNHAQSSPFRTQTRTHDMQDLIQAIFKKTKTVSPSYQLEPRDRNVVVELPQLDETEQLPIWDLKEWISEVCTKVVSSAFNLLISDKLSYDQAKVSCSEGILRNMVLLVDRYQLTQEHIRELNSHIEVNVVPYLKRKYPMTESMDVNKSLDEAVKPIDKTDALEHDLLFNSEVIFTYREDGNYNKTIMEFLNWLMQQIDSKEKEDSPKSIYEEFYDQMVNTFEKVYSEQWMSKTKETMIQNSKGDVLKPGGGIDFTKTEINEDVIINQKYADQVKEYTHFIIGRKISKNVPTYSQEELEEGHLSIKSPAILRILTKWCEELWGKFKKKNYFLDLEQNLRVQEKGGNKNTMFMWMKIPLNDMVEAQKVEIEAFMKDILSNNFDQQTQLLRQELNENDGFCHIDKIEKVCGKFATKTVSNLHSYIVIYLNRLIHGLLKVSQQLYQERLSTKARWTSPPDLLTFKVGDLMRCKCSSKERQILHIYKQLQNISRTQPKLMKIIRVKNRLKLGTNDILINVLYKKKYLCEIQLAVKSAQSKFISCSNAWNHYIYELGRTIFGPITELSSVWISLDPRSAEYAHIILNEKPRKVANQQACISQSKMHELKILERPFICSKCKITYSHTNYFWNHMKCDNLGCNYVICARCRIDDEKEQTLKHKLLGDHPVLLNAATEIVNRKQEGQQVLPKYGICIPICSKQIKIMKFKKLEVNKIVTIFGLDKTKKGKEKVIKVDELIKQSAERKFLKKYLVFDIPEGEGQKHIDITQDRAKKECIIPAKVREAYKKQKQMLSLIEEKIDDESISITGGKQQSMNHIKNLELADNKLTNISFIANNFKKLERLQLSRNQINNIEGVSNLKYLSKLNLRNNKLTSLPDQITKLSFLKGLNIRHNKLPALPEAFGQLRLLQKLQSDNNLISELPESFKQLKLLEFIDLSANKFTQFPQHIKDFSKLQHLALAKNKLGKLPSWIGNFQGSLTTLDLSKTAVENFPDEIFSLKKIQVLKIQSFHNELSPKVGELSHLRQLSIQMKNVDRLPDQIFKLTQLSLLELEDSPIYNLPNCLSEMKKLQSFGLVNNKLDKLSDELNEMVGLRNLKLEGQNLQKIPQSLQNLSNLRTLSLNNNKLVDFPEVVLKLNKLYCLKLKNTHLKNIPNTLFEKLPDLEQLDIQNNDIHTLPLSLAGSKKLTEKKFKYDKEKVQLPSELKMIFETFEAGLQDQPFFARTLTFSHIFSRPSLDD